MVNEISNPTFTKNISGYNFWWEDTKILVRVERLSDDGVGELSFIHNNGSGQRLLHMAKTNLLSTPTLSQLAKKLKTNINIDWDTILTHIAYRSLEELRRGEPIVNINQKPSTLKLDYLLYPILVKNEPTTIFAPGGTGKSVVADIIAVMVKFNVSYIDWKVNHHGNVLYLDWEASQEIHQKYIYAIKNGLNITNNEPIYYRFCEHPIMHEIENIQKVVADYKIELVIIDSQMAATGQGTPGTDASQVASQFYNCLRSLRCTTLTIDHVTKESMKTDESVAPFGSIVKWNRSRSQFEIKKSEDEDDNTVELAIIHRKFNLGRKIKPLGVKIEFVNDKEENLTKINLSQCELANNPELASNLKISDKIKSLMNNSDGLTDEKIWETVGGKINSVRHALKRGTEKGLYCFRNNKWYINTPEDE